MGVERSNHAANPPQLPPFMLDLYCRMQEAQKRDSEAAELAAKMEKEKKEMQVSTIFLSN